MDESTPGLNTQQDVKDKKPIDWSFWATLASTAATISLAVYAIIAHQDTTRLMAQQSSENTIENRAYVSIYKTSAVKQQNPETWIAQLTYKDFGQTPAYDTTITMSEIINGNERNIHPVGSLINVNEPGEDQTIYLPFEVKDWNLFANGTNNYIKLQIKYKDFTGVDHQTTELLDTFTYSSGLNGNVGIYSVTAD